MKRIRKANSYILDTPNKANCVRERNASRWFECIIFVFVLFTTGAAAWGEKGDNETGRPGKSPNLGHGASLPLRQASGLPDLSGMAWLGGDRFLVVHDAKTSDESANPRVSLLYLPADSKGVLWRPQAVNFLGVKSNDLESAARIPGTNVVLLAESGDDLEDTSFQRIFKARVEGDRVRIIAEITWPVQIHNVEATAVAAIGDGFVFLFAERAQNLSSTDLRWAVFDPKTLSFGPFRSAPVPNPDPKRFNRPLVAMELDNSGLIYISSAFDAEAANLPDPDNGPFASAVFCIGELIEVAGKPEVILFETPQLKGTLDGFKVESIAVRENDEYGLQIFVGFDDENYGATIRLLRPPGNTDSN
jgi:hypothetical protein